MKEIARFKNFVVSSNTGLSITKEYWDEDGEVLLYTAGQKPIKTNYLDFPKELLTTKNDILVARNGAGAIQLPELNSIYTDHVIRFILKPTINKIYVYFALWNCVERIANEANDVSLKTLSKSVWIDQAFYVPSIDEQTAIAEFLLNKCENIDTIIAMEETIISELNEYKNQLAVHYTTKGIRETKFKQSNIDWVGEMPEHWKVLPLFAIFNEHKCKNFNMHENNLLSLSYGNIIRKDINTDEGLLPENFESYNIVEKGDIVLRLTDMQNDQRSLRTGLVRERGIITSAYVTIRNKINAYPEYLRYLLHSTDICKIIYNFGSGIRQNLTFDGLKSMPLVLPPINEQKEIAQYLDKKYNVVDNLINIKQQKITELKEYKKSLIYEYVTGKKEPTKGVYE